MYKLDDISIKEIIGYVGDIPGYMKEVKFKDIKKLATILRQAFYLARTGRPGPVLVDIPKDIIVGKTKFVWPEEVKMRRQTKLAEAESRKNK